MTEQWSQSTCEEKLAKTGFEPICAAKHCEEFAETDLYHEGCAERSTYSPVQSLGCYNEKTAEWRFAPPDEAAEQCEQLQDKDPAWTLRNCYCCCGQGPDGGQVSVEQGRERLGEMLGLGEPVSEQVLAAALHDRTYARNLLATREAPELLRPLLEMPPEAPEQPTTVAMASGLAKALARWASTGFTMVEEAVYERRLQACSSCPHEVQAVSHPKLYRLVAGAERPKVCGLCGCSIARKARLVSESCPAADEQHPGFTRWGEPVKAERLRNEGARAGDPRDDGARADARPEQVAAGVERVD
jgi:hypothetical protein